MKRIAILGSTGSIGTSCLDVIAARGDDFEVVGLVAGRSWEALREQCQRFSPRWAVLGDESLREPCASGEWPASTSVGFGSAEVERLASCDDVDVVVSAIVGAAGLKGTWAAVQAGKRVALANKETMVVAGPLVMDLARQTGAEIIPVDSEHSALFQGLLAGRREDVKRIVLTASGGPFRGCTREELAGVTPERALDHPTWDMGPKITIDSATMMNKALEIIEAKWLFDLRVDQIDVVIHPQSIVHSFVEFVDGSMLAQLSPPDMKLPIQYALTYPERVAGISPRMDFSEALSLDFDPPDYDCFTALRLGLRVAEEGGTSGAVLNAANEVAVRRFLDGELEFLEITETSRTVLDAHAYNPQPTLDELLAADTWAREAAERWSPSQAVA